MKIKDLKGLSNINRQRLSRVGIHTVDEFMSADAFDLYKQLKETVPGTNLNFMYSIIAAQENKYWHQVIKEQRMNIIFHLDEMGLAPRTIQQRSLKCD
ncbi:hypothetical protein A9Q78_05590 [Methylophaga sp. 41_12_T18]|nr:hypothetical protein A9Q78_05590 [Methylophaga sp. 41_12_T18]